MVSERLVAALRARVPNAEGVGCFLCAVILEDLKKHGELTGYPLDFNGQKDFPREAKLGHLAVEGFSEFCAEIA